MKSISVGLLLLASVGWLTAQSDPTAEKQHTAAVGAAAERLALVREGKPVCKVVTLGGADCPFLMKRSAETIVESVRRWSGVELQKLTQSGGLPNEPVIVLATYDQMAAITSRLKEPALLEVPALDPHGFSCQLLGDGEKRFLVVARTPRGVYNGAQYLADFLIDGPRSDLFLEARTVVRSPQMQGRPIYLLTIWGNEDEYTERDFAKIFDSFARDGMDRIYFWASGHFPSQKFPQTYKVKDTLKDATYDSTTESGIDSVAALQKVIRHAHDRGLMLYLGGALGGWVGTRFLTNLDPATFKKGSIGDSGQDDSVWSLCPSLPAVRKALVEYWVEMFDACPEADGLFIESADEMGGCNCSECGRAIDKYGSKQFGQAQLSLVLEIMNEVWRKHPHARLAYTVGYEPHKSDPAYYEAIRKINDPRFEWMEARGSWEMPGPEGEAWPAAYFSKKMMGWKYHDARPAEQIITDIQRMGRESWYGAISTFSPGFNSGSFYRDIPFPTDLLPYVLTHFLHREMTWEPAKTLPEVQESVQARFFGREAPKHLGRDLWKLREMVCNVSRGAWGLPKERPAVWQYKAECGATPGDLDSLDDIARRIDQARPSASPKTSEGLDLMSRAIRDLRAFCAPQLNVK